MGKSKKRVILSHNPYFNRWFSAIKNYKEFEKCIILVTILILIDGFLQSKKYLDTPITEEEVTILILIDGFLQLINLFFTIKELIVTILILIDGFLQFVLMFLFDYV